MARDEFARDHVERVEKRRDIEAWRYNTPKLLTYSSAASEAFLTRFDLEGLGASPERQKPLQKDLEEYFASILVNAPGWWLEDFMQSCVKGHFAAKKEMARRIEAGCYGSQEDEEKV